MEPTLLIGIAILGYIGAFIVKRVSYPTEKFSTIILPGTIAWLVVVVISFFIALTGSFLLFAALIFGGATQSLMDKT